MGPTGGAGRQHFSLGTAALIPAVVLGRRLSSQEHPHPSPISAPAVAQFPFLCPPAPPPTPYKEPQELRLRRGSCPLGHVPHVGEKKYTPLNTEHMGEGRDTMGEGEAGTPRGGWAEPPASSEAALLPGVLKKRRKSYNRRGEEG